MLYVLEHKITWSVIREAMGNIMYQLASMKFKVRITARDSQLILCEATTILRRKIFGLDHLNLIEAIHTETEKRDPYKNVYIESKQ